MQRKCIFNLQQMNIIIFTICSLISIGLSGSTTQPTWLENVYIKAGTNNFFTSLKPAGTVQQFTIIFRNQFTYNPYIAYGISKYSADDYLLEQLFMFELIYQDRIMFTIKVTLNGVTNLHLLDISFIAFQQNGYPYFLNILTDIPLGYVQSIANFSNPSPGLVSVTEDIDYTNDLLINHPGRMGPVSTDNSFNAPYTNYKIAVFITTLQIFSLAASPVELSIEATVLNQSFYRMTVNFGYNGTITALRFCQVFLNMADYNINAGNYMIYQQWTINSNTSHFYKYSSLLAANFMMGLKSFKASSGQCVLEHKWENTLILVGTAFVHGAQVSPSIPIDVSKCGLSQTTNVILLFMTWFCPWPYVNFDPTGKVCRAGCNPYYYHNSTDTTCYPCNNTLCYGCHQSNTNICTACDTNMIILNGTCLCNISSGIFLFINKNCLSCNNLLAFCQICSYSGNIALAYNSSNFVCISCNRTANYYLDLNSNTCMLCTLSNCAICVNLANCQVCNLNYGIDIYGKCSTCPIFGCQTCINLTACSVCNSGYSKISNLCYACPSICTCGGYVLPRYQNGDCSTLCGDGIIITPYEECDDNNTINGDGCSSNCLIQPYSTCANSPSQCYLNTNIVISLIKSQVSFSQCNTITLSFKISPHISFLNNPNINWENFIIPQNTSVFDNTLSTVHLNGILQIKYTYTTHLQNQNLAFVANPKMLLSSSIYLSQTFNISINTKIVPSNNVAAIYCTNDVCQNKKKTESYTYAQTGISYFGLLLSIFSCKIIGLQLFGVLQLSYFSLSIYDFVHPLLASILGQKQINGLNVKGDYKKNNEISARVQANGYISSNFLANFNLMYLFGLLIAAAGSITYCLTYFLNKDKLQGKNLDESLKSQQPIENKQKQTRSIYWHRISKYVLKQILLTFLIFNMFNLSYSIGIQILYINQSDQLSILCILIAIIGVFAMIAAQIKTDKVEFGQYFDRFKEEKYQSKYIVATLIYRFVLGLLMALLNEFILCSVVCIFVSASFLTYISYFDPFKHQYQNNRSKIVHSIHILILFVAFYYRVQGNYDQIQAGLLNFPAYIMLISIGVCTLGSTVYLAYQFIIKIKQKFFKAEENINDNAVNNKDVKKTQKVQINNQETIVEIQEVYE